MLPDVQHILSLLGDGAIKAVGEAGLRGMLEQIGRFRKKRQAEAKAFGDNGQLHIELDRIQETVELLAEEVRRLSGYHFYTQTTEANAEDPAFATFVDRALTQAVNTTVESKRAVIASMIARRLALRTDSTEETQLRRAAELLDYLSESQLILLAAIVFIQTLPGSKDAGSLPTKDAAEAWLDATYRFILPRLQPHSPWNRDDFEMLAALGAIRLTDGQLAIERRGRERSLGTTEIFRWLSRQGISPYDGVEGQLGSRASHEAQHRRFPIIHQISNITTGNDDALAIQLDSDVTLTPVGRHLGSIIFDRLASPGDPIAVS